MSKKTTVKPIALGYREVGGSAAYTSLMGVLKGLAIAQDDPNATEIEAEFYDSPFDIIYQGQPVKITFELAHYDLSELPALFGGTYDPATHIYSGATTAFTSEHEWKLSFGRGINSLIICKGLTIGTLKKDADGALNYSVTITALVYNDGNEDKLYQLAEDGDTITYTAVQSPSGNPKNKGYYEKDGSDDNYRPTWDTTVVDGKTYYTVSVS